MRQYESYIPIIITIIFFLKKSCSWTERGERVERERERIFFFFSSFLSKIYENQTIRFHWSKRQSWSMHRELRVGTKILEFRQTPRGREFFYLCYF